MKQTLYFYDLETSGFHPATDRIMQFAGQRTDTRLQPIGQSDDFLIKLPADVLPSPDAVLVHGITPQQTLTEGLSEAEFLVKFQADIATSGTIFVGFNTVRFDDEFMRYLHYRNLYDAYTWQWEDGKGRWDLLDVVRMMRALRPEGIRWPTDSEGKATNRLELLSGLNGIEHTKAHNALGDVQATLSLAQLVQAHQPKLFDFLFAHRDKAKVRVLVLSGQPFVYTSGKYDSSYEKTTIVQTVCEHPDGRGALVFDLRHDPTPYLSMNQDELVKAWQLDWDDPKRLPVKTLKYNRCPAIAPLSVVDEASQKRLSLDMKQIQAHNELLEDSPDFADTLTKVVELLDNKRQQRLVETEVDVDSRLYEAFPDNHDKQLMAQVHRSEPKALKPQAFEFHDQRMKALLPLYKARNYPKDLDASETAWWQRHVESKLFKGEEQSVLATFLARVEELKAQTKTKRDSYLLDELELFGLSLLPSTASGG